MVYTIAFLLCGRATDRERRGATVVVYTLVSLAQEATKDSFKGQHD